MFRAIYNQQRNRYIRTTPPRTVFALTLFVLHRVKRFCDIYSLPGKLITLGGVSYSPLVPYFACNSRFSAYTHLRRDCFARAFQYVVFIIDFLKCDFRRGCIEMTLQRVMKSRDGKFVSLLERNEILSLIFSILPKTLRSSVGGFLHAIHNSRLCFR